MKRVIFERKMFLGLNNLGWREDYDSARYIAHATSQKALDKKIKLAGYDVDGGDYLETTVGSYLFAFSVQN